MTEASCSDLQRAYVNPRNPAEWEPCYKLMQDLIDMSLRNCGERRHGGLGGVGEMIHEYFLQN